MTAHAEELTRAWSQWLRMPPCERLYRPTPEEDPLRLLPLDLGRIVDPDRWPTARCARIYVAFDNDGPVYVGQTTRALQARIRGHLGALATADSRSKAETWTGVVSAPFDGLRVGELDHLERCAADWLLPWHQRKGRRHPK